MKKIFLLLLFAVFGLSSYAQKGMQSVGVNLGYANNVDGFGSYYMNIDAKYQYHWYKTGRVEPFFSVFVGEYTDFAVGVNFHQFLNGIRRVRPYLLFGLGYGAFMCEEYYYSSYYSYGSYSYGGYYNYSHYEYERYSSFMMRGGLGLDIKLANKFSLQTEVACLGALDVAIVPQVKVGFVYNF